MLGLSLLFANSVSFTLRDIKKDRFVTPKAALILFLQTKLNYYIFKRSMNNFKFLIHIISMHSVLIHVKFYLALKIQLC